MGRAAAGLAWLAVRHEQRSRLLMRGLLRFPPARLSERLMQLFTMFLEGVAVITESKMKYARTIIRCIKFLVRERIGGRRPAGPGTRPCHPTVPASHEPMTTRQSAKM